ncbi:clathrin light chain isoform X1 [Neodiprion pinetum]|uniref:Clathrin light chain n=1 Tax=Neodiprion lecontei TaxID=441921 RepID=A0ABM3GHB0_NEOLC|nr:clathrin light chain isoform X2 [Neodiprion pinetum]XP_046599631.1 clathrin light chain isoform X1 [Neodiprion lecontei]
MRFQRAIGYPSRTNFSHQYRRCSTMDAFGDKFFKDEPEVDPAAEFLAREQDQLAGLEDEIPPATLSTSAAAPPAEDDFSANFGDLKGGPGGDADGSFVMINAVEQPAETPAPELPEPAAVIPPVYEEPEKIRKWREEQKQRLEEKDLEEEKKKEDWREAAKKELEEWYKHHSEAISKTKATNRESAKNAEKQFVAEADEVEPGTEWERIAKLCDFNPKSSRTSKDVSRMRSIILQLKQTPPAPVNA